MIIPKLSGKLIFGGDYNPEQWPESVWIEDMKLMRQAGINLISLAIFSWAKLQPSEDTWDFGWLDRVMDLLAVNGIYVCLATSTASPPAWLIKKHPEILPVTKEGLTLYPGSRQHYSPSSSAYREAASRLVEQIASHYKNHPALAAWHINNEYACHMPECHNPESTQAFRRWLERKYETINRLNEAWGTAFWSQLFSAWDEIDTPRLAPYCPNPTQQLDFKRFTSDAFLELLLMEKAILTGHTPDLPITTNFMGFFKPLDYHRWAEEIDFTAWDSYPDPVDETAGRQHHALGNDLIRSLKPGIPFVLMEQAASAINGRDTNLPKRPGLMRLWSMQTVARGGDGVMYFQWRASKAGTEKFHSAVVQHVGAERSRVFREVEQLGTELKKLAPVSNTRIQAEVAIVFDWDSWWSVELDSRPGRIDYCDGCKRFHDWFYRNNIPVDFVSPGADLKKYKLVIAPSLYMLEDSCAKAIESYVAAGGTFLATFFSGIVDTNDHVQLGGYPARLKELLGIWVEEWRPYTEGQGNQISIDPGDMNFGCDHWADIIHVESAEILASFDKEYFAGQAAFTENFHGKGSGFYLGTRLSGEGLDWVMNKVCRERAGVSSIIDVPDGVELSLRESDSGQFLFILNHTDDLVEINLEEFAGKDLLTGASASESLSLDPLGICVLSL